MKQSYFIIGTDTNVGKTYVASALVRHFAKAGYQTIGMKPIASGCEQTPDGDLLNDDVLALSTASNVVAPLDMTNPYRFSPAIAPHIAAEQAGEIIDCEKIKQAYHELTQLAEVVVVEGAGGFLVPLNRQETLADLAVTLNIPMILVVGMRLGCINHALLTVEAIKSRGLTLAGWVANQVDAEMPVFEENLASLQQRIAVPCISVVRWQNDVNFNADSFIAK
ncbi:dethiobiotin synthase [Methylotenera sp.]|jgi:dethiobiotin synthetase|uniref:dethiobiotin synthase n=1 Tax=Methylotenera sp. TaxID=2051956 RepID=UPI002732C513|nr:dethiobiotin synthase [Methylotenera sp.]MDP3778320.1 dethiobiotin synthase [Methylotenera sp.]